MQRIDDMKVHERLCPHRILSAVEYPTGSPFVSHTVSMNSRSSMDFCNPPRTVHPHAGVGESGGVDAEQLEMLGRRRVDVINDELRFDELHLANRNIHICNPVRPPVRGATGFRRAAESMRASRLPSAKEFARTRFITTTVAPMLLAPTGASVAARFSSAASVGSGESRSGVGVNEIERASCRERGQ